MSDSLLLDKIASLASSLCDGTIEPVQFDELQSLLRNDRTARRIYIAYLDMHGDLRWDRLPRDISRQTPCAVTGVQGSGFGVQGSGRRDQESGVDSPLSVEKAVSGQRSADSKRGSDSGQRIADSKNEDKLQELSAEGRPGLADRYPLTANRSPQLQIINQKSEIPPLNSHPSSLLSLRRRPLAFSLFVSTVATVIFLLVAAQIHIGSTHNNRANPSPPSRVFVAQLASENDCVWAESSDAVFPGAHLWSGQVLELKRGLAVIAFKNGANVTVEGPAVFALAGNNGGRLDLGRLTARISRNAVGFSVETSAATVVDLGTEFGITVDGSGKTQVHVFEGSVFVRPSRRMASDAMESGKPFVLEAGSAVEVKSRGDGLAYAQPRAIACERGLFPISPAALSVEKPFGEKSRGDGATPIASRSNPVSRGAIQIDGRFDDWEGVARWEGVVAYPDDPADDATGESCTSVDLVRATIAHDADNFYFHFVQAHSVGLLQYVPWVFLDTDQNAQTGLKNANLGLDLGNLPLLSVGAEFHLAGSSGMKAWDAGGNLLDAARFGSSGFAWAESSDKRSVELQIPRPAIGNPRTFRVVWIATNHAAAVEDERNLIDYYPDEAADRDIRGYFRYSVDKEKETPTR